MTITIRFFALLRDRAGVDQMTLSVSKGATVSDATKMIADQCPSLRELLNRIAFALNREYVEADAVLHEGDELALIPPVSGGAR